MLRIGEWWQLNANQAPDTFKIEFTEAMTLLAQAPGVGALMGGARQTEMRRLSLKKSRQHIYYRVDEFLQVVTVLQVWHTSRGAPPKL